MISGQRLTDSTWAWSAATGCNGVDVNLERCSLNEDDEEVREAERVGRGFIVVEREEGMGLGQGRSGWLSRPASASAH